MAKGFIFMLGFWAFVSFGIFLFSHLSKDEKVSLFKCGMYGLVTAVITGLIVLGIVFAF